MTNSAQSEIAALQRGILLSKAERAKAMPGWQKMLAGPRLFDQVRELMKAGIRARNPDWSEDEIHSEFLAILAKQREVAERGIYRLVGYLNDDGSVTPVDANQGATDEK